ncbi:molybdopterin molybdotransferase MoeA [Bradyrhizobium viridifuturi]|jgi:molybdopterin molybdotransferase|uniref:molybdopterin molybdotransferase MoeA n=1 Tax=Bradyrhizobium TaxID=374 RepID=UPI000396A19C|nr:MULTISPECIES: gephyrin-like molybdotransferase Glp [Bradyrhizobium]ERF85736.1 MAG: molybdenum cofactor synthesis domain-containing protein [Bradyrhizobium sp. DFCI-1]OYU63084.1 MAG: molybdopterin molybdenumtransferase MoeA [Bradyrhizobium sp. PARBB1]PSO23538.1 molybdopterin molybdenumtransferase MoeA [Bradyrhizobium sp. MOS004]QRI73109.1 molybdopterin molybdotransferase MoeA [Bradyrhizobium sp. PSBB068]MBR1019422.1 molybdopterin molybdotransferase MoeA [Bradyrhizobium viridifuturi]
MALMPVADALSAVLAGAEPLPQEMVALDAAYHRTLARDLAALRTQPPLPMSAMDGYAVRAADAASLSARLKVIGEVAAGRPFERTVGAGEAVRIFTGGVIPDGADAVIIQEDTRVDGDHIAITEAAATGRHIRAAGVDFREGDVLLTAGSRLSDRALSLAAAMNYPELAVHRRPKVAVLATGDELVMPGSKPGPGQIVYSNGYALRALARAEGAETVDLGVAADTLEATTAGIRRARETEADILITTGGASVGDHDLVKQSLEAEGVRMAFWRIAMRPGKPMMHGRLGAMRVIGLPGNPVSSYVCAFLFLVPLIRALSGRKTIHHVRTTALLGRDLAANDQREDYLRARLEENDDGTLIATPVMQQDSSLLGNLAAARALLVRPPFAPAAIKGSECEILTLPE